MASPAAMNSVSYPLVRSSHASEPSRATAEWTLPNAAPVTVEATSTTNWFLAASTAIPLAGLSRFQDVSRSSEVGTTAAIHGLRVGPGVALPDGVGDR